MITSLRWAFWKLKAATASRTKPADRFQDALEFCRIGGWVVGQFEVAPRPVDTKKAVLAHAVERGLVAEAQHRGDAEPLRRGRA